MTLTLSAIPRTRRFQGVWVWVVCGWWQYSTRAYNFVNLICDSKDFGRRFRHARLLPVLRNAVYIHIRIHFCVHICKCVQMYMCIYEYTYIYAKECSKSHFPGISCVLYVNTYIYIHIFYMYIHIWLYIYVWITYMSAYTREYMSIHTCIRMYIRDLFLNTWHICNFVQRCSGCEASTRGKLKEKVKDVCVW